jgi:hypothetical protein
MIYIDNVILAYKLILNQVDIKIPISSMTQIYPADQLSIGDSTIPAFSHKILQANSSIFSTVSKFRDLLKVNLGTFIPGLGSGNKQVASYLNIGEARSRIHKLQARPLIRD